MYLRQNANNNKITNELMNKWVSRVRINRIRNWSTRHWHLMCSSKQLKRPKSRFPKTSGCHISDWHILVRTRTVNKNKFANVLHLSRSHEMKIHMYYRSSCKILGRLIANFRRTWDSKTSKVLKNNMENDRSIQKAHNLFIYTWMNTLSWFTSKV